MAFFYWHTDEGTSIEVWELEVRGNQLLLDAPSAGRVLTAGLCGRARRSRLEALNKFNLQCAWECVPLQLKVMTFNLRYSNEGDGENAWPRRKELAARMIRDVGPDVIGVQEALFSMLCELDEMLPEYEWIGEGRGGGVKSEFSAVLYKRDRLQPITADRFWLSHRPDVPASRVPETGLPRMCTHVRFRERGTEREFLFYNTHLDHASQVAREIGADLIVDHILEAWRRYPLPTLVVGDMNATPGNPAIAAFLQERDGKPALYDAYDWLRAKGKEVGATFHGFKGRTDGAPIDYIFHSSHWRVEELCVDRRSEGERYPSDHFPVWGVFATA